MRNDWKGRSAAAIAIAALLSFLPPVVFGMAPAPLAASAQTTAQTPQLEEIEEPAGQQDDTQTTTEAAPGAHTHRFGAWKTTQKASNKQAGQRVRTCKSCGETETQTIARIASVSLKNRNTVYTGSAITNEVTVKDKAGNTLRQDKDYTVKYKHNKNVGNVTVTIKGKGDYEATITRYFRILPQGTAFTSVTPGDKTIALQWTGVKKQADGYLIQYATDKSFKKNLQEIKVTDKKTTAETLKGLTEMTAYYLRIRSFKTVDKRTFCSPWSKATTAETDGNSPHAISGQVPKSARVEASYFDDVVFVGDSVSLGLNYYEAANDALGKAQFLTAGSLGSGNALEPVTQSSVHPRYNGQKMKIEKAVPLTGAKKVYIMLGMNDIAVYGTDGSAENMRTLCRNILKEAPEVQIYVQSVTPRVNQGAKSDNGKLNNTNITKYNKNLAAICAEECWYFVNVAEFMFDSTDHLIRSYCSDPDGMGMHFSTEGCKAWVAYLYTHTA